MSKAGFIDQFDRTMSKFEKIIRNNPGGVNRDLTLKEQIEFEKKRKIEETIEKKNPPAEKDRFIQVSPFFNHEI